MDKSTFWGGYMKKIIETLKNDKYWFNVCVVFALFLILLSIPFLLIQFRNMRVEETIKTYDTRASKSVTDKVRLEENNVFENDSDGYYESSFYIASMVEDVNIKFFDTLNLNSSNHDLTYSKAVKITLIVEGDEGVILEESNTNFGSGTYLQESGKVEGSTSVVDFNQEVNIDYTSFVSRFSTIRDTVGINCTATIEVVYSVSASGKVNDTNYSYFDSMTSYIPVQTTGTFSIDHSYSYVTTLADKDTITHNNANYYLIAFAFILDAVAIALIVLLIIALVERSKESASKKAINKILNQYDDILVNSDESISEDFKFITLKSFEDIVKVETELSTPIIWKNEEDKYLFYIYGNNVTYIYTFDMNEKKEKNNDDNQSQNEKNKYDNQNKNEETGKNKHKKLEKIVPKPVKRTPLSDKDNK